MTIMFAPSARSTVGIEWEIALVDAGSGELRGAAREVLEALRPADGAPHSNITGELLTNTIELVSGAHAKVSDAVSDLRDALSELRGITEPIGIDLICAGSHPFAQWQDQQISDTVRYQKLIERTQWWGRNMMIWGVHVHVGIEDRSKVFPVLHALLAYSPHLQALAASSPFWAGEATGYASNRALMFQQLPTAGLPFDLDTWAEFERYVSDLIHTGVIDDVSEVRWDVRPAPRWGTIEFRACDGVSTTEEIGAIGALIQCLSDWHSELLDRGDPTPHLRPWFVRENKWRAARYGLDAIVIIDNDGTEVLAREHLAELLGTLEPVAERLDCAAELAEVHTMLARGASYQRQLDVFEHSGDLHEVTRILARELRDGLR